MNIQDDILRGCTDQVGDELIPEVKCAQHYYEVPEPEIDLFCAWTYNIQHLILLEVVTTGFQI